MDKEKLIYLASPYNHEKVEVMENRYNLVKKATSVLLNKGYCIFSPIVHNHHLKYYLTDWTNEKWLDYDFDFLIRCDELWVLTIDGWSNSNGVSKEISFARENDIVVCYYSNDEINKLSNNINEVKTNG